MPAAKQPTMILRFSVPLTPPSVNHYVKHTRTGRRYVTAEAQAFKDAVAIYSRGLCVEGKRFIVSIRVVLAEKQKGDVDNFPKLVLDGLADAGVFVNKKGKRLTDAAVRQLNVYINDEERGSGRTEVFVTALG